MTTAELLSKPLTRRTPHDSAPRPPVAGPPTATDRPANPGSDPRWARPALIVLLVLTALAYIWDLSASGYANSFYAAAVQAGTKSWKALFFGSLDSSNFITVDKPPASLWVMAISGRIFGFSSWSMLIPQALEGVAAVALLHAAVKRWFGAAAGLAAGAIFALTPVAALMFRFNNPDALLVLMLVAAAYCLVRALERGATRWIVAVGVMLGIAFLAKMMQAFLVLPAFAGVYLLAAPVSLRRRLTQLLAGAAALVVSAGWWVAIVALWPAGSRPFIDGSPDNSILNLITGYNGLGRIFGGSGPGGAGGGPGGGGGGGGGTGFSGETGPLRLFNSLMGGQASWLLPAALIALAVGLWSRRGAPRTDRTRAALVLWGGWLLVTAAVFSFSKGVIHTYYTVALAPAIAALVAIGAVLAWRKRDSLGVRIVGALAVVATAIWAHALLARTPSWEPWLRSAILIVGIPTAIALLFAPALGRRGTALAATLAVMAAMAGPTAFAVETITSPHTGSIVSAGPAVAGGGFGQGGAPGGGGRSGGFTPPSGAAGKAPSGLRQPSGSSGAFAGGAGASSSSGAPSGRGAAGSSAAAGMGGGDVKVGAALTRAMKSGASSYRWVAATSGSQSAASLELASGEAVMGIGGFNNEGGNLTLAQFEAYVAKGQIHYYIASGSGTGGGPGGGGSSTAISEWVAKHFKSVTLGSVTAYDLTSRTS
ncbi:MAG TPA: glycosyltransferase family 39 protein [Solirubrobacteraceae bacterium]|nr:glycosyltransferase family 39 protein [Solirubrobacteraceae bacterium]